MHKYLRAIGFSNVSDSEDVRKLLELSVEQNDTESIMDNPGGKSYGELKKEFAQDIGICSRGEIQKEFFEFEYYYPYFDGRGITTYEDVYIERQAEKECYMGACDDSRVGVTIIFYLQNMTEYLKIINDASSTKRKSSLTLSALSVDGKILFSVSKNQEQVKQDKEDSINRTKLIEKAKQGDEQAMESLTLDDIDTYSMISRRIIHEDVFTIVDTYFMPYGMECDKYSILGEILEVAIRINRLTQEELYIMKLSCNELVFDVCINKKDLLGEPMAGRRFKGTVWLQGKINFMEE
ncbi:MAG: DUF3881 family protein [Lachnospiraceae bacterium]|nr:DUF3881 family protein [Lachnospiraceae bacterium]MDY5648349.1 DUF3881 family protein [Lachnospiraceae bacterium]